MRKYRVAS